MHPQNPHQTRPGITVESLSPNTTAPPPTQHPSHPILFDISSHATSSSNPSNNSRASPDSPENSQILLDERTLQIIYAYSQASNTSPSTTQPDKILTLLPRFTDSLDLEDWIEDLSRTPWLCLSTTPPSYVSYPRCYLQHYANTSLHSISPTSHSPWMLYEMPFTALIISRSANATFTAPLPPLARPSSIMDFAS